MSSQLSFVSTRIDLARTHAISQPADLLVPRTQVRTFLPLYYHYISNVLQLLSLCSMRHAAQSRFNSQVYYSTVSFTSVKLFIGLTPRSWKRNKEVITSVLSSTKLGQSYKYFYESKWRRGVVSWLIFKTKNNLTSPQLKRHSLLHRTAL